MMSIFLADAKATYQLGIELGKYLPASTVLLLEGDLGAGKTTLVQGIGRGLGIEGEIVSPTFNLINEYTEGRLPLYHLDLYRLSVEEVEGLYPEMYWQGMEVEPGITAIEWAERLPYKPSNYLEIQIKYSLYEGREIEISVFGEFDFAFGERLKLWGFF
jgi:tRNA threonylcarbamoyladenosine biosynthesis protein TsaE